MNNNNFVKYKDLLTIKKVNKETDKEEFVFLPEKNDFVSGNYIGKINMKSYGNLIPIRKTVYEKLISASKKLKKVNPNYKLIVVYGFRDLKMQEKYFNEILESIKNNFSNQIDMYEYIHEKIAVPEVSGHPTGGAVDIEIFDISKNQVLDFGTEIHDWDTTDTYYISNNISDTAKKNRKLLRDIMLEENFAPYDGEWWHFSYGDKEWAFYYKKNIALYDQKNADEVYSKK